MPLSGLLNLDKPYGMTSFQAVNALKRRFGWKKTGHTGTLDPLATGVLLICIGKATRLIPFLTEYTKRYQALVRLGIETQTLDREGEINRVYCGKRYPPVEEVKEVINGFRGQIEQIPPMYSALKHKGRRLFEWARDGKEIARNPRKVWIHEITCRAYNYPFLSIDVMCSKGTYIRTLASDIGCCLGTGAHLWALNRVSVGEHRLENSLLWSDAISMEPGKMEEYMIPAGEILSFFPSVSLDRKEKEAMIRGRAFFPSGFDRYALPDNTSILRIYDSEGEFLGLGRITPFFGNVPERGVCIRPYLVLVNK